MYTYSSAVVVRFLALDNASALYMLKHLQLNLVLQNVTFPFCTTYSGEKVLPVWPMYVISLLNLAFHKMTLQARTHKQFWVKQICSVRASRSNSARACQGEQQKKRPTPHFPPLSFRRLDSLPALWESVAEMAYAT